MGAWRPNESGEPLQARSAAQRLGIMSHPDRMSTEYPVSPGSLERSSPSRSRRKSIVVPGTPLDERAANSVWLR